VENFLNNLLPEGHNLDELSKIVQISKNNTFGLIVQIGSETTGAVSFGMGRAQSSFRTIDEKELAQRIQKRKEVPITLWDGKPRMSVAGVQDKLPITILDGKYGLGEGGICSTHILKFDKEGQNLVFNEALSLHLARAAGLEVNNFALKTIADEPVLLIERFDRKVVEGKVKKIHIIDGCQALDLPPQYKYEKPYGAGVEYREGASFAKLFDLDRYFKVPIIAKSILMRWVIVNLCLGNTDAHAKNISFFLQGKKLTITPFYDIVNVSLYAKEYDTKLAMGIDDIFDLEKIGAFDLAAFCDTQNINPKVFAKEFIKIAEIIKYQLAKKEAGIFELIDYNFVEEYRQNVVQRIDRFLSFTGEIERVDKRLL
jgi:serine/threonine-protein kinase HipA